MYIHIYYTLQNVEAEAWRIYIYIYVCVCNDSVGAVQRGALAAVVEGMCELLWRLSHENCCCSAAASFSTAA